MDGTANCGASFFRPTTTGPFSGFPAVSPSCVVLFSEVRSAPSSEISPGAGIDSIGNWALWYNGNLFYFSRYDANAEATCTTTRIRDRPDPTCITNANPGPDG